MHMSTNNSLPSTVVFVDYESWYWSLHNHHRQRPDIKMFMQEIKKRGDLKLLYVFGDFTKPEMANERMKLRSVTNNIIDCAHQGGTIKDYTDFIMLDHIYQVILQRPDIEQYVLLTGDGHFCSVAAYLINFLNKIVGVVGVSGMISRQLRDTASWCEEIRPQAEEVLRVESLSEEIVQEGRTGETVQRLMEQLYRAERRGVVPKFLATVKYCASVYHEGYEKYAVALNRLIEKGYIRQNNVILGGREIRVLVPLWDKIQRDEIYSPPVQA